MAQPTERSASATSRPGLMTGAKSRWVAGAGLIVLAATAGVSSMFFFRSASPPTPTLSTPTAITALPTETLGLARSTIPISPLVTSVAPRTLVEAQAAHVLDGDTLEVTIQGRAEIIQLLGVNAPELLPQPLCFGAEASAYVQGQVTQSKRRIWLEGDVIGRR